jgi:RND family efflux transporter MFP subunit
MFLFVPIFSCTQQKSNGKEIIRTVRTDTVRIYSAVQKGLFPGKVKAASDVSLSFRIAGPITKINAEAGRFVRKGQTVAEMDSRDYELQLAATEAEYKRIKAEADRVIELHKSGGGVTDNDYDKAVYGLKQIAAKYDAHRNALADTRLTAPFDGYIQKRFFVAGETVGAGMPVLSIIDAGSPEVEINIPSSEYVRQSRFDSFSCTVDIYPDKVFPLDLLGITHKANMNQLYTVRLKMRGNNKDMPSPGMITMVGIEYKPEQTDLVSIPYSALFENNSTASVWIYNPDSRTVSARKIYPSQILTDGTVVVSEGLSAGEIVVSAGVHSLFEGEKVNVMKAVAESNVGGLL